MPTDNSDTGGSKNVHSPWLKGSVSNSPLPFSDSPDSRKYIERNESRNSSSLNHGGKRSILRNRNETMNNPLRYSSGNDSQVNRKRFQKPDTSGLSFQTIGRDYEQSTPYVSMPSFRINPHVASQPQLAQHAALTVHSGTKSDQGGTVLFFSSVQKKGGAFTASEMETHRQLHSKQGKRGVGKEMRNGVDNMGTSSFLESKKLLNKLNSKREEEENNSREKEEMAQSGRKTMLQLNEKNVSEKLIHGGYGKRTRFDISSEDDDDDDSD